MPTRVDWVRQTALTRDRVIVLGLVNTLQPVGHAILAEAASGRMERGRLRAVVHSLNVHGMLARLPTGEYVVTRTGRDAVGASGLGVRRDVSRMQYLFKRSKGGGAEA